MPLDDPQELFTQVTDHDEVIGPVLRAKAHNDKSIIHRSIGVFILNNKGEMLFQKRSVHKDKDPGFWSYGAGGHVPFGKNYEETATRELKEELGIVAVAQFITKPPMYMATETEYCAFFEAIMPADQHIHIDTTEVEEVAWVQKNNIKEFVATHQFADWSKKALEIAGYLS